MSMLDKFLGRTQINDDEDTVTPLKKNQRKLRDLKIGDEIIITQRVRVTDLRTADDKRIGAVSNNNVLFMEVQGIGGVFNNSKAIASGSEHDRVEMAQGQVKAINTPRVVEVNDREEDTMHGTSLPFDSVR